MQAAQQQKFRELQEVERRKRFEEQRARDHDKFIQVEERRKVSFYSFLFYLILLNYLGLLDCILLVLYFLQIEFV